MRHLAAVPLLVIAPLAIGAELNEDFLEAGYFQGEIEDDFIPADFDVIELRGNKAFGNWQLVGGYRVIDPERVDLTFEDLSISADADFSYLHAGAGHVFAVSQYVAIPVAAGLVRESVDTSSTVRTFDGPDGDTVTSSSESESDTGYFVNLGLRARVTEHVEVEFEHRFMNVSASRLNDQRLDVRYAFTPAFALGIGYRDFEDDTALGATIRWNF